MIIIWNKVTWYSKLLAVFVGIATIWLGVYFTQQYKEIEQMNLSFSTNRPIGNFPSDYKPADHTATSVPSDFKAYKNDQYGFEISYPKDFNDTATQNLASGDFDNIEGDILKATFPDSYSKGTNLAEATVFAGAKNASESECLKIYGNDVGNFGPGGSSYTDVVINGVTFHKAKVSDAGAGNFYSTIRYATMHNNLCYQISMVAHSNSFSVLQESNPSLKMYNQDSLAEVFKSIISTFKFTK